MTTKLPITSILAAAFVCMAPAFAQTPPAHVSADKMQDEAEHKAQWKECMSRMEANEKGGAKSEGQHKNMAKNGAAKTGEGSEPQHEPKGEGMGGGGKGEGKKMNRHEQMMAACREQLYGNKEGAGKEGKAEGGAR
jgi:hypothetical protein